MNKYITFLLILIFIGANLCQAQIVKTKGDPQTGLDGFVDSKGNWVYPPTFGAEWFPKKKVGVIKSNGHYGVINENGKIIIPCEYESVWLEDSCNLLYVKKNVNYESMAGCFDFKGNVIVPCIYPRVSCYTYGISVRDKNGLCGVYDFTGEIVLDIKYSNFLFLDGTGEPDFSGYSYINYGGTKIKNGIPEGGKWGVCDKYGHLVVPCEYEACCYVGSGLFAINRGGEHEKRSYVEAKGGKWGIYGDGRELYPCVFDEKPIFVNDVAKVKKDGEIKLIKNPLKDGSQIQIAENSTPSKSRRKTGPAVSRYPAPDSDVDRNIPTAKKQADNTFAFIIANENYPDAPVPYSLNDGRMFREYCHKALGLPEKNINLYEDATFGSIITAVEKMKSIADAYDGEASVIFYYAGHGFPDEKQNTAYLLPIDGNASDITTTGYSLAKLYKELSQLKLKSSIIFLDACFSGAKREDQMLSQARGVAIKVKDETPQGNMVVFSAAQGDETAHQMEEKRHGLFTYYLLKQLQATGGDVDMGTLTEYVTRQVKRQSVVINNKKQTPTVIPSQTLLNSWKAIKLK